MTADQDTAMATTGGSEIMSSIQALKEILFEGNNNMAVGGSRSGNNSVGRIIHTTSPSPDALRQKQQLQNELHAEKESRYEERVKLENQIRIEKETVQELKRQLKEAREEAKRDRSLRQTLEEANEALEEHKKELSKQLENAQLAIPPRQQETQQETQGEKDTGDTREMEVDDDKQEKQPNSYVLMATEKASWENKIKEMTREKERLLKKEGEWEARYLGSQRKVEELQQELASLKKELENTKTRHQSIIKSYTSTNQTLKERLEQASAALMKASKDIPTNDNNEQQQHNLVLEPPSKQQNNTDTKTTQEETKYQEAVKTIEAGNLALTQRLEQVEKEKSTAEAKIKTLQSEIKSLKEKPDVVTSEPATTTKEEEEVASKLISLRSSFGTMSKAVESLRSELKKVEEDASETSSISPLEDHLLAHKKLQLEKETGKMYSILESLEPVLQQNMALSKAKADKLSQNLASLRDVWRQAKEDETNAQVELEQCQARLSELQKALLADDEPDGATTAKRPTTGNSDNNSRRASPKKKRKT